MHRVGIGQATQTRQQIRRQQSTFAAVARGFVARRGMQQRTDARGIERGQALRAQRRDHARQQIAHAADGEPLTMAINLSAAIQLLSAKLRHTGPNTLHRNNEGTSQAA